MPKGGKTKRLVLLGGLAVVALLLAGLITGEIGAKLLRGKDAEGILRQPEVVLPPEPIFPESARAQFKCFEHAREGPAECAEPEKPFKPMGFFISNTILSSWLTSVVLILIFAVGMARPKLAPRGLQNFCEMVVEALLSFCESVVGKEWGRRLLPVIATIFLFVAFNAWMGLLPIYPSLGFMKDGKLTGHLLRPAGTDLNMPMALGLIAFVFIEMQGLRALGFSYIGKFVRVGSLKSGVKSIFRGKPLEGFQGLMDFGFVGPLEAFSEFVRVLSFTFRLFGNMTAGEILVIISAFLVSFVATVVVYGLEILVGFVQALIFAGLTLVFSALAIAPHHAEEGEKAHH